MTQDNQKIVREALEWIIIAADMATTPMCDESAWKDDISEKAEQALTALENLKDPAKIIETLEGMIKVDAGNVFYHAGRNVGLEEAIKAVKDA